MAYFRACAYGILNDYQMQKSWFAVSAINDLRCCVMNQASLWTLARILSDEGDLQRAYKYVECSWKCVEMFNANLRNWQVSPVLKKINDNYKAQLTQKNSVLMWFVALISVLTLILLVLYIYAMRKRRQLAAMRNELKDTNEELALLNLQLSHKNTELSDANTCLNNTNTLLNESNRQLSLSISHLNDSNRIKDEYIGKFLSICSEYIEKLDSYRIKINRKLKAGQYADLLRITGSQQLREDELKELLENFDSVFLRLFPTFVDDFNMLLKPQERVSLPEKGKLNTDLRIFALIRLGIDESSKIAEFLHYSPNSIYAYRARIKNKAISDRNEFEKLVKEIGI
ncbi:MAG: DUF6377 domain-containing protein [Bacteroidales bacterium]|nr:DUF6377 domain-containing protein [Bacteroidales bacterium]